ncbi:UNKNOWN [Stylonychia lemnae]|uniref:Uncharacterized protein n=1 Tax=Stylonychia lemnae TaxID=5949 RepID=A0A078B6H1_STYLE|nr:UNKNOWN [Stylonychia lemnae]|eukprot:CDW89821.1 UNKNOWN [Stylonychia lemnae]
MVLLGFGIFKAYYLFMKYDANISKVSQIRSMSDGLVFKPQEFGIYETDQIDSTGKKFKDKIRKNLKLDKCQDKYFNYTNQSEVVLKGISNYLCTVDDNYQFQGNFYQQNFEYVEIKLWKCLNSSSPVVCQDKQKIDEYFERESFNFAFINTYFDFNDYDSKDVIKKFIDDSFFLELEAQKIKKSNIYIQLQQAETQDSYLQFGQFNALEFHQISNQRSYDDGYSDLEGYIAAVYMRFDNKYDRYSRKIYSILEFLGDIGGLYRSLFTIGFLIVGQIASHLFFSDLMHKIYQVRKKFDTDDEDQKLGQGISEQKTNEKNDKNIKNQENQSQKKDI